MGREKQAGMSRQAERLRPAARAATLLLAAACLAATASLRASAGSVPTQGSFFEQHMSERLGVSEHGELHRRLHEAAAKAQADAEAVRDSGEGTSEYLAWRRRLDEENPQFDQRGRRLEVLNGVSGTASLVAPALNSPPGPGDFNITCIRHGSVTPPAFVDWRASSTLNTPVYDQRACESCWLWAASDIISMKWALLSHFLTPIPLSPQHVCDCGYKKCCGGGWPEWTFLFAKANKGVAPLDAYAYVAKDNQACRSVNSSLLTGKITGWEKLPASDPVALVKTISMHPVVVLIQATSSFLKYTGGVWMGTDCPARPTVNHAVVLMGYNATGAVPYWIAKNSWGSGWGEGGYIRIAMVSRICGFGSEPSLYPTMYRVKTPCDAVPPPCGNGTCYLMADGVTSRCQCPKGFVEKLEYNAPKCITATPCNAPINPCAFGTCSNEFDGTYTCWCPPGTVVGTRTDGAETCIVNTFQSGLLTTQTIPGDNCSSIAYSYNISIPTLLTMNPFLNCSATLKTGLIVMVGGAEKGMGCGMKDVVGPGDTCDSFAAKNSITTAQLLLINPTLNCSSLLLSQHLCVQPGQFATTSPYERSCGSTYVTDFDDNCLSIALNMSLSLTLLQWLNPGIDCTAITLGQISICTSPLAFQSLYTNCNLYYNVTQGDTCFTVASAAGLDLDTFLSLNPGIRCTFPNWLVGLSVCINGTAADPNDIEAPVNMKPVYVSTYDTILGIATKYTTSCALSNGTDATPASLMADMCWANGWYPNCNDRSIVPGSVIFVPCAPKIGWGTCLPSYGNSGPGSTAGFYCGANKVTYMSNSCASVVFATATNTLIGKAGPCSGCDWLCTGLAGAKPSSFWGTCVAPSCTNMNTACAMPAKADSSWSQFCPSVCDYAFIQCSQSTYGIGANTVGCTAFQKCVDTVTGNLNCASRITSTGVISCKGAPTTPIDMAVCFKLITTGW